MSEVVRLKVGDVVQCVSSYGVSAKYTIERVTKARAYSKTKAFYSEFEVNGYIHPFPADKDRWTFNRYKLETPELKAKWEHSTKHRDVLFKIKEVKWENFTLEQLEKVETLLSSFKERV